MRENNFRYGLDKSSKKYTCPNCEEKRFVRYIDNTTNQLLDEKYGRCDRENTCGYFYSPYDDKDYNTPGDHTNPQAPTPKPIIPSILPNGKSHEAIQRTESNFHTFCREVINITDEHLLKWLVGAQSDGKTLFGIHDGENLLNMKSVMYRSNGKRNKDFSPLYMTPPKGKKYDRCLYGLHLIDPEKPIAIVESEKTAVIAAFVYPQFSWLSSGGNNGARLEHLQPILELDQAIYYFADNDKAGKESRPRKVLEEISKERPNTYIIDPPADWPESWDIADFVIERPDDDLWAELGIEFHDLGIITTELKSLEITFDFEPEIKRVLASIHGIRTLSVGNIMMIIAAPGTGKSSLCDAIAAGHINPDCDSLGVKTNIEEGRTLLHIDGERTHEDCKSGFLRTAKRIQIGKNPHLKDSERMKGYIFHSFIAVHNLAERKQELETLIIKHNPQILMLDDISCLSRDSNNVEDSQEIIRWLIALANEYKFGLITTIHPNPKDETFKPRGHLGSELYRKAESAFGIFRTPDNKEIRMLTTDFPHSKVRNAVDNITSNFKWSNDAKMFVSCEYNSGSTHANKMQNYKEALIRIFNSDQFKDVHKIAGGELNLAVQTTKAVGEKQARRIIQASVEAGFLMKEGDKKTAKYYLDESPF